MSAAEIVGIILIVAGAYIWAKRGQVLLGAIVAILGVCVAVGAVAIHGSARF